MKKYCLTAKTYDGEIELLYDNNGLLQKIDFAPSNATAEQRAFIKHAAPITIEKMVQGDHKLPASITIVDKDILVNFEDFWKVYPYKRNRYLAEEFYSKMNKADQATAYLSAIDYAKYCQKNAKWYNAKIAELWLKKKEFMNDWKNL